VFIGIALVSIVLQPRLDRLVAEHRPAPEAHGTGLPRVLVFLAGVYGGYFGAAQGILLLAILGLALPDDLHRGRGLGAGRADRGRLRGGRQLAARYGRRLPPRVLRAVIVAVGIAAIVQLVT
jgi:hypothetical protein